MIHSTARIVVINALISAPLLWQSPHSCAFCASSEGRILQGKPLNYCESFTERFVSCCNVFQIVHGRLKDSLKD